MQESKLVEAFGWNAGISLMYVAISSFLIAVCITLIIT